MKAVAPSKLVNSTKSEFPTEALQALPNDAELTRNIRRWRRPIGFKNPTTRSEINLLDEQKLDHKMQPFLFHDSADDSAIYNK